MRLLINTNTTQIGAVTTMEEATTMTTMSYTQTFHISITETSSLLIPISETIGLPDVFYWGLAGIVCLTLAIVIAWFVLTESGSSQTDKDTCAAD